MKDIVITSKRIRKERNAYLLCFVGACLINVAAIIGYGRPWIELVSQIGYVFFISLFLYACSIGVRGAFYALKKLFLHKI